MYTSGCPKNQNKCWYNTGSPPPEGSKNVVLKFLSVNNIVIAPASTGTANNNRKAVIRIDQTNKGIRYMLWPGLRILNIVVIKLIAPNIEEAPDRCRLKIARSTAPPEWLWIELRGGYKVHPVPAPTSTIADPRRRHSEGGKSQKLILFNRGKAISGAPIIIGTNQLPNPPINTGITMKKIIKNACSVTNTLYTWWLPNNSWLPGCANSIRINIDAHAPNIPEKAPKIKYRVPISLWLVEYIQRKIQLFRDFCTKLCF